MKRFVSDEAWKRNRLSLAAVRIALLTVLLAFSAFNATGCADAEKRYWLDNMARVHGFTDEEIASALNTTPDAVPVLLRFHGVDRAGPSTVSGDRMHVVPYPGGRHPRIGFLDGAIDPHRDTKASVFLPWPDAGYVVVDLPEAIWSNGKLAYLAHTHIPTIWTEQNIELERQDWERRSDGELYSHRVFPNGMEFIARVIPLRDRVDMELTIRNGTNEAMKGVRTQNCVMLGGAPEFTDQTNDNKTLFENVSATSSRDGRRWIVTGWDHGKGWANPKCPCLHSDPKFPDLKPGDDATLRGWLAFHDGPDLDIETARRLAGRSSD